SIGYRVFVQPKALEPMADTLEIAKTRSTRQTRDSAALYAELRLERSSSAAHFELNVKIELRPGITILFGPSGAGKTSLLDCIAGLANPEGRIVVGERIFLDSAQQINLPARERGVGYVFQDLALFPHMNVKENIGFGLQQLGAVERKLRIGAMLESLGIRELRDRTPAQLSGG